MSRLRLESELLGSISVWGHWDQWEGRQNTAGDRSVHARHLRAEDSLNVSLGFTSGFA